MQLQLISNILDELKQQLEASGIRSLLNWITLMLKIGKQKQPFTASFDHYDSYEQLTDQTLLCEIRKAMILATQLTPYRTYDFYNGQSMTLTTLIQTYFVKDGYENSSKHISLNQKREKMRRHSKSIVIDKAEESNFSKPAYYVLKEANLVTIVVRGTANKFDTLIDIDVKPVVQGHMNLHSGFLWHAQTIYSEMKTQHLIQDDYQYITTGHSMGGAVASLLGFVLYNHFFPDDLESFDFAAPAIMNDKVRTYAFGAACSGCERFSKYCEKFCTTVVNGFDVVPAVGFHGLRVQQQRLLFENQKKFHTDALHRQLVRQKIARGEISLQKPKAGEKLDPTMAQVFEVLSDNPTTREISEKCLIPEDLVVAGHVYHYIRGNMYKVTFHDISEFHLSYPAFLDHFCYIWVAEQLESMLFE